MAEAKKFIEHETDFQGRYASSTFDTLRQAYRPVRTPILWFLLIGFIGRILLLSNANLIGIWVDSLCRAPAQCQPIPAYFAGFTSQKFLVLLTILTTIGFFCTLTYRIGFSRNSARAVSQIYDEVTLRTSRLTMRFFDTTPAGRIMTRFSSDYGNVFRVFGGPLAEFFAIIFDLLAISVLICFSSPILIPIFLLVGFLNYQIYRANRDLLRRERRAVSSIRSPSIAHFAETAYGASSIRIFTRQNSFYERFAKLNDSYLAQRLQTYRAVLGFSMKMSLMSLFLLLLTGLGGYFLLTHHLMSVGAMGVAFAFIALAGTSMQMFFEWMAQFEEAMTGIERLDHYLRMPLERGLRLPSTQQFETGHPVYSKEDEDRLLETRLTSKVCASVQLDDLWFRYDPELPHVLKGINLFVAPGEKLGIVGRTGSGKSSLVQALFYLYPFERGRILLDGRAPNLSSSASADIDLQTYRQAIAYISQEPTLFRGTLRENLSLHADFSDRQLTAVLNRVGLQPWLNRQSETLDAPIDERGRNLSAGERQLICMARCLLQESPIVVMDEATSSVDPQTEELMVLATQELFADRTQIIIAHRLSTLQNCDRILWLQNGEIKMLDRPERVLPVFQISELSEDLSTTSEFLH